MSGNTIQATAGPFPMGLHRCVSNSGAPACRPGCEAISAATIRRRLGAVARLEIVRMRVVVPPPDLINVAARKRQAVLLARLFRWCAAARPYRAAFLAIRWHHRL